MTALLPCPFCGSAEPSPKLRRNGDSFSVICECDAEGPWAYVEKLAADHWNRRTPPAENSASGSTEPQAKECLATPDAPTLKDPT